MNEILLVWKSDVVVVKWLTALVLGFLVIVSTLITHQLLKASKKQKAQLGTRTK